MQMYALQPCRRLPASHQANTYSNRAPTYGAEFSEPVQFLVLTTRHFQRMHKVSKAVHVPTSQAAGYLQKHTSVQYLYAL